jgi:cyclic-di-GMP-binding biofilm dispersal mediator protein
MTATTGQVAIIGATGALGQRIARLLRGEYPLVLLAREQGRIPEDLTHHPFSPVDLRKPEQLTAALEHVAHGEGLHGVVNAAGVVAFGPFGDVPPLVSEELMAVNATSVLRMLDTAARHLPPGGFVVNLTGVAGEMALTGMGPYCASKYAAAAAMKIAGKELGRRGIRVLDVRLGHCETGLAERALHGTPPRLPRGIDPDHAAARIVQALHGAETLLRAEDFTSA